MLIPTSVLEPVYRDNRRAQWSAIANWLWKAAVLVLLILILRAQTWTRKQVEYLDVTTRRSVEPGLVAIDNDLKLLKLDTELMIQTHRIENDTLDPDAFMAQRRRRH